MLTLVVWKLDRLGRTVKQLVDLVTEFESKRIHFKILSNDIDTSTSVGWKKATDSKIKSAKKLLRTGMAPKDVANDLGVSLATLYRWIPEAAALSH